MKKRKTLKSRALAWILNTAMLVGLMQGNLLLITVQAADNSNTYETIAINNGTLTGSTVWGRGDSEGKLDTDGGFYSSVYSSISGIQAYCTQTENSGYCSYYGEEKALPLTLTTSNMFYIGNSYNGAQLDSTAWAAAGLAVPEIYYEGIEGTTYAKITTPPATKGTYQATVTAGEATASARFSIDEHEHDDIVYISWPENASGTTLSDGNYVLTEDVTLTAGVKIDGNVNLCLNGHTLTINPSSSTTYKNLFYVNSGKTLSIYDCAGNGKITGGQGYNDRKNYKGGAIYLKEATLNLYGGSIEGNSATWGGAIFVDATSSISTINMYGGSIQNNTAADGGGGIELENPTSTLNMYGGSIVNNTVTNINGGYYKGGGIHHLGILNIYGTRGDVQIIGNTVAGVENNVYLRTGKVISIKGGITENSRIGVSAFDVEKDKKATTVTSGYGSAITASEITNFFMDGTHSDTTYALVQNGEELQIVPHSHAWNYEVNETGTEIRAYCTNSLSKCDYYGTKESHEKVLTLTLSAADAPYSGSPYSGTRVDNNITSTTRDEVNIEYYKDSTKLPSAPTDAGTYTVKVTIGGATISSEFTIFKEDAACTAPTANTLTYDGTAQNLVSGGTATGGEMYYRLGTDGTWTTTIPTAVNAGDYVVYYYVKADTKHNSIASESNPNGSVNVTINQKSLAEAMISLDFIEKNYTGSLLTASVTVKDMSGESNLITLDDYTIDGTTKATEVGNYTITVTGKGNYTGSIQKDWRIIGADFEDSEISAGNVTETYTGEGHGISVSVTKQDVEGVQVRYKDGNGEYTLTECPTYSAASPAPYRIEYEVTAKGYNAYRGSATVTINPKEVELEWSNTSLIYNGMEQKPTVNVKAGSLCGSDTCTVILGDGKTDSNAKAGADSYSITATGLSNSNYKLPSETEQLTKTYTIAQKEVGIDWSNTEFTYDGQAHKPTAALTGVLPNETCNVTVTGEQTDAGADYTATASIDNANYKIKTSDESAAFVINPKEITGDMISLDNTEKIYAFTNTAITPIVTVKDGGAELTSGETGDYILSGDLTRTAYGRYEITVTGKGNYTGTSKVVWSITDTNAPTGNINITTDSWKEFLSNITFERFFKETKTVTITAEDGAGESGVDKVYYYKSIEALTLEQVLAVSDSEWTELENGGSFNITPDAKLVIYAKLTDKSGNITYISSDGLVLDATAPAIVGVKDSRTYCSEQTITVTDTNMDKVTVNGMEVSLTDGSYTLSADGSTYAIAAADKAGNITTVIVTVKNGHTWKAPVFTWSEDYSSVTATFTCANDSTHVETKNCEVTENTTEPTCTEAGKTVYTATVTFNGEKYADTKEEVLTAPGHDWGEWTIVMEATEKEEGKAERECTRCGEKEEKNLPVLGHTHTVVTDEAVAATCTTTGLTEGSHCSVCGEILVAQETIEALGHDWGEWKVVKEATETEEGKAERECTRCGEKEEKNLPVLGHTHTVVTDEAVAATCTTTGLTEGSHCSVCGEILVAQETIAALGHDWSGEWTVVKEATATEDGKRETYCTRGCGQKKVEVIPAIGSEDEGDTNGGAIQKDAEVAKDAPINEATLDNKKSELLNAVKIFTAEEKSAIENGKDARVWLEVNKTDENNIPAADKAEVKKAAEKIMGENPDITYFDADLFKQLEGYEKKQLHEPGIDTTVTIKIPDELLNHDRSMVREYKIIRLHYDVATGESNVEVLGGSFNAATGEFTFATDKFSTYAIAYNDIPVEDYNIQHVTGITLSQGSAVLTGAGETLQLTATVAPENATDKGMSWLSSDTSVATVDAYGKVTAVGSGTCAIITTTYDGYHSVTCMVTVNIQSDNGNDVSGGNGSTGNSESGSTDSGSTAGNGTGSSESGSTGVDESGSGNAGNTGNTGTDVNTGDGQITAPSTGGEGASGRMVPIAVFMMLALAGAATVIAVYSRKKRVVR